MKSFIQRLFSGALFTKPDTGSLPAAIPTERVQSATASTRNAGPKGAAHDALVEVGSRRPVIDDSGLVIGYEFCIPAGVMDRLNQSSKQSVKSAYVASLLASASLIGNSGKIGFARIQAQLIDPDLPLQTYAGVWVGIESPQGTGTVHVNPEKMVPFIARLRAAGARVGWEVTFVELAKSSYGMVPDFVLLHQGDAPISALLAARNTWPESLRRLQTLATDVCSEEDLEAALQAGIAYVCGAFHRSKAASDATPGRQVPPDVLRLASLMKLLLSDAELSAVATEIKGDVGLSYRLLGMMKSARFANRQEALHVEQVVLALGRDELYRILSVMMLRYSGTRKVSSALEAIALWRSRLLELLAIDRNEAMPGHLFTLGLVSMLACILKLDVSQLAEKIALAEPAKQALLTQDGPWYAYLFIATELEAQHLDPASPVVAEFGGSERIHALSDVAWNWAEEQSHRK